MSDAHAESAPRLKSPSPIGERRGDPDVDPDIEWIASSVDPRGEAQSQRISDSAGVKARLARGLQHPGSRAGPVAHHQESDDGSQPSDGQLAIDSLLSNDDRRRDDVAVRDPMARDVHREREARGTVANSEATLARAAASCEAQALRANQVVERWAGIILGRQGRGRHRLTGGGRTQ